MDEYRLEAALLNPQLLVQGIKRQVRNVLGEGSFIEGLEITKAACANAEARAAKAELMVETLEKSLISQRSDFEDKIAFQNDIISSTQENVAAQIRNAKKKERKLEGQELLLKQRIESLQGKIQAMDKASDQKQNK